MRVEFILPEWEIEWARSRLLHSSGNTLSHRTSKRSKGSTPVSNTWKCHTIRQGIRTNLLCDRFLITETYPFCIQVHPSAIIWPVIQVIQHFVGFFDLQSLSWFENLTQYDQITNVTGYNIPYFKSAVKKTMIITRMIFHNDKDWTVNAMSKECFLKRHYAKVFIQLLWA